MSLELGPWLPPPLPAEAITGPANQRVIRGGSVTMRFTYRGTAPFTFQWRHNGADIPGATGSTLPLTDVQVSDAGSYTVLVSNSLGSDESPVGTLTVDDVPYTDVMTPAWSLETGTRPYLANDNNTRSIAISPATGNLLLFRVKRENLDPARHGQRGLQIRDVGKYRQVKRTQTCADC